ncbi:hypothetical protein NO559_07730 [Dasania sp. GY-MA-18]|uniref:Uncharacterized protein n=1 Tax=Dasania phycosphaerae TaxID=2950436 RepID=A0A9J6RK65_9GAMM|nr:MULTISPECIES: hypothetical protein [Dasania]MCR8922656.1 hypothetical protein [Dasania sp. GY-MA-18]MCZ0865086.1 hypothetical protein [Dasania phycosphaerae]MCZ0868812.1 hypothetical protein [Dasania phycosphaerae]
MSDPVAAAVDRLSSHVTHLSDKLMDVEKSLARSETDIKHLLKQNEALSKHVNTLFARSNSNAISQASTKVSVSENQNGRVLLLSAFISGSMALVVNLLGNG